MADVLRPFFGFQTNVIEASPDMKMESEKEWYYGNAEKERLGPYSYEEVSFWICASGESWYRCQDKQKPLACTGKLL